MQNRTTSLNAVTNVDRKSFFLELNGKKIKKWDLQRGGIILNRSKIEWCDHTWNPVTGCLHNCEYCYARKMSARFAGDIRLNKMATGDYTIQKSAKGESLYILDKPMMNETGKALVYPFGFEPTFHRYRLNSLDNLKMGNNIFVGAMADLFGEWAPDKWIIEILDVCVSRPQHNYLFLTKNPKRYWELEEATKLPAGDNMWYGYSMTTNDSQSWGSMYGNKNNFVSVEPVLEDLSLFDEHCLYPAARWVIIGAETGKRNGKVIPKIEWIEKILIHCDKFNIPVFMKDSLLDIVGESNMRKEFPAQLKQKQISTKMKSKMYGNCCICNIQSKKSDMITLSARSCRGEQPKQFAFMCKKCFKNFCSIHDIESPDLKNMMEE